MVKHTGGILAVLVAIAVVLIAVATVTVLKGRSVERRLGSAHSVAPCRTFGTDHPECVRQANLILTACLRHPKRESCERLARLLRADKRSPKHHAQNDSRPHAEAPPASQGGGSPSGSPAPSSPGPANPGPPANPPGQGNPPNHPGNSPVNKLLDDVRDAVGQAQHNVCHLNPLGIRICG